MTTDITTSDDLYELLAGLGDTADEIAGKMRAAGIKGYRSDAGCCPIARWLVTEADFDSVEVDGDSASVWSDLGYGFVSCSSPPAIREFIIRFDTGVAYVDLNAEGQ